MACEESQKRFLHLSLVLLKRKRVKKLTRTLAADLLSLCDQIVHLIGMISLIVSDRGQIRRI